MSTNFARISRSPMVAFHMGSQRRIASNVSTNSALIIFLIEFVHKLLDFRMYRRYSLFSLNIKSILFFFWSFGIPIPVMPLLQMFFKVVPGIHNTATERTLVSRTPMIGFDMRPQIRSTVAYKSADVTMKLSWSQSCHVLQYTFRNFPYDKSKCNLFSRFRILCLFRICLAKTLNDLSGSPGQNSQEYPGLQW